MKLALILLLLSSHVFAQDDSKCLVDVQTSSLMGTTLESNEAFSKNPAFMSMLEKKNYLPTFKAMKTNDDWDKLYFKEEDKIASGEKMDEDLLKRLDNKILLKINGLNCSKVSRTSWSIKIGKWSKSNADDWEWSCPPYQNKIQVKAISNTAVHITPYTRLGDVKKKFASLAEAENFLLEEYFKFIPTCQELRRKMPEVGKVKIEKIVNDLKEIESAAKNLTPAQDGDLNIKNDNASKEIIHDQKEQDSTGTLGTSK